MTWSVSSVLLRYRPLIMQPYEGLLSCPVFFVCASNLLTQKAPAGENQHLETRKDIGGLRLYQWIFGIHPIAEFSQKMSRL